MLTDSKKAFLRRGDYERTELNQEEYFYYQSYVATARKEKISNNLLFFGYSNFILLKGYCTYAYNSHNELLQKEYKIGKMTVLSPIENKLIEIIKEEFADLIVFTNLLYEGIFRRLLITKGIKLISLQKIKNIERSYQDLIGTIQHQGFNNFFPDTEKGMSKERLLFQDDLDNIVQSEKDKIYLPPIILSLVNWFALYE